MPKDKWYCIGCDWLELSDRSRAARPRPCAQKLDWVADAGEPKNRDVEIVEVRTHLEADGIPTRPVGTKVIITRGRISGSVFLSRVDEAVDPDDPVVDLLSGALPASDGSASWA